MEFNPTLLREFSTSASLVALLVLLFNVLQPLERSRPTLYRCTLGLAFGAAAILLIALPVTVFHEIHVDGKVIVLSLAGAFLPAPSALIVCTMTAAFRYFLVPGPYGDLQVLLIVSSTLLGHLWQRLRTRMPLPPFAWLLTLGLAVHAAALVLVTGLPANALPWRVVLGLLPFSVLALVTFGLLLDVARARQLNVEALRRANADQELQQRRLNLALQASGDGMWEWRPDTGEVHLSDSFYRQLGYEPGAFPPTLEAMASLVHPDDHPARLAAMSAALSRPGVPFSVESRRLTRQGQWRWHLTRGQLFPGDGADTPGVVIATNTDIHDSRTRAATLEQLVGERTAELIAANEKLARARDDAEAATRAKSEFLANMSHEIRTPMNAVLGMTDLALRGELSPRQRDYLTKAQVAADLLLGVINDILDFSKIEAGKLQFEKKELLLQDVLDRLTALLGDKARQKGLVLRCEVAEGVPPAVVGDPLRLEQVLLNLCSNALKFTDHGAVTVQVRALPSPPGRVRLAFDVADTGIGMTAEQACRLFQPFSQLDAATTRRYGGTGLGLAICKMLVNLMEGDIAVTSTPGQGSHFCFDALLDAAAPAAAAATGRHPASAVPASGTASTSDGIPPGLRGKRALLVEDNELNQMVATELLGGIAGMEVVVASQGAKALELLRQQSFDLVLMDVQMPGMDGYEATAMLRREPRHAQLPVIAMTAHAMASDREKCFAAGMNDYLPKPFEPAQLFAVIARWLPQPAPPPRSSPPTPASPVAGGVSFEGGLRRCLGRRDLYGRIVDRFIASRADDGARMQAAWAGGDLEAVRALAHNVTSTAGTLGAARLSDLARRIQLVIASSSAAPALGDLVDEFEQEHALVLRELRHYAAGPSALRRPEPAEG